MRNTRSVTRHAPGVRLALIGLSAIALAVAIISSASANDATISVRQVGPPEQKATLRQSPASKSGEVPVRSANPYLSFLPQEVTPDYSGWKARMRSVSEARQNARQAESEIYGSPTALIAQSETEAIGAKGVNDTVATAEPVPGFGSGAGEDAEADLSGNLKMPPVPLEFFELAEDDGDINKASDSTLGDDDSKFASSTIGDGDFGSAGITILPAGTNFEDDGTLASANVTGVVAETFYTADAEIGGAAAQRSIGAGGTGTGDFDFYRLDLTEAMSVIFNVYRQDGDVTFRPIIGFYDAAGNIQFAFDDFGFAGDILATIDFGPGTWYVAIGGNLNFDGNPVDEFLSDASDSDSGPGAGSEGLYTLDIIAPTSGDFDFYSFSAVEGDTIDIEVDTDNYGELDPIIAVYDSTGVMLAFNDDAPSNPPGSQPFDSRITLTIPSSGTYYVAVGGFIATVFPTTPASFLSDPFDSSTGPGVGSEGDYDIIISRNVADFDYFSFDLEAGDIIAANVVGGAGSAGLFADETTLLNATVVDIAGIYPPTSALPGGGNASMSYIVNEAGTYYMGVGIGTGAYTLELRVFRPPQEATGTRQKLFLDFDGAVVDTTIFDSNGFVNANLSPLSAFLADWGLVPGDEDALIDAIIAEVRQAIDTDISVNGLNSTFDIEILNSRDHVDPFGDPDVSRIIVGGTQAESGIQTIGIAQSVDVGNFDMAETALVLLDGLASANPANPNSLNQYGVDASSTKIALIAAGVGNVISHEAGHFFANFHTDNSNVNANLMDTGGNLGNIVGVGADNTWGTGDDENVVFITDDYDGSGGLFGVEDTKNTIAFGLTTGAAAAVDVTGFDDASGDGIPDFASFYSDPGNQPQAVLSSGADGSTFGTLNFLNSAWVGVAIDTVDDANGDGVADDPAVAMLLTDPASGKMLVHTRVASSGSSVSKINFLNPDWTPIDVVVFNDTDGDGNPSDASIGVLAVNNATGKILVQVRDLDTGAKIATRSFLNLDWKAVSAASVSRAGQTPLLGILGVETATGKILVQTRQLSDGALQDNQKFLSTDWTALDIAAVKDGNSDGTADDPGWLVLANNAVTGVNLVQARMVDTGMQIKNVAYLTPDYGSQRLATSADISGNGREEAAVQARRLSDDQKILQVRDFDDGTRTGNIFP